MAKHDAVAAPKGRRCDRRSSGLGVRDRLGHFNDLMQMGALSGVKMGLDLAKVPHHSGGVLAAMEALKGRDVVPMQKAAAARA